MPGSRVFLVSGGGDMVDTAAKLARAYHDHAGEPDGDSEIEQVAEGILGHPLPVGQGDDDRLADFHPSLVGSASTASRMRSRSRCMAVDGPGASGGAFRKERSVKSPANRR